MHTCNIYCFIVIRSLANVGGGGGGGGLIFRGLTLNSVRVSMHHLGGIWEHAPQGSSWKIYTCSEINTETASFEQNIMLQSDKRQKKKKSLTCKYCSKEGDGHSFERAPTSATRCPRSDVFTATRCPRRK